MSAVGLNLKIYDLIFHKALKKQQQWQCDNTDYELSFRSCIAKLLK